MEQPWYYVIELAPGLETPGQERRNLALTRSLLARVDVRGKRCLDVGTEEAVVPILLERRGAKVVAYDRVYSAERLALVRESLETSFELIGEPVTSHDDRLWLGRGGPTPGLGLPLDQLPVELLRRGHAPFDVVVFSGVLYHVYDPLSSLARVRGLVREGGIVIVETAATFDGSLSLHLNGGARYAPMAIWLPSAACLDHLLRLVRLEPLAVTYFGRERGRIAVACRAVSTPSTPPDDEWLTSPIHDYELAEHLGAAALEPTGTPIGFDGGDNYVNVFEAVRDQQPLDADLSQRRLDLAAMA